MASLQWSEMKKYSHRVDKFLSNIDSKTPFELNAGTKVVLMFNNQDPNALTFEKELRARGVNASPPKGKILVDKNKKIYSLGELKKTIDFGGAGENKGNVAEGIIAAALGARFLSKTKNIDATDVQNIIDKFPRSGNPGFKKITLDSPNESPHIIDELNIFVELAANDMTNFLTKKYPQLIKASVAYANKSQVKTWADTLYKNNTVNTINVKSMGISGQTATKVDTYLEIGDSDTPPRKVDVNLSLKAGDVKQFGQEAGLKWEAQERLWKNFGIDMPDSFDRKYTQAHGNKQHEQAFKLVFEEALKRLKRANNVSVNVAKAIVHYATLRETDVDLLQLKGDVAVVYQFSRAVELISDIDLSFELKYGSSQLPSLIIQRANDKAPLVKLRVKKSGPGYYRTIVEKESLMGTILAMKYT